MKVIFLSDIEEFCDEHNFKTVGIQTLRDMAVEAEDKNAMKAFKLGYAKAVVAVKEALAREKP
jgi:hypothetical protein